MTRIVIVDDLPDMRQLIRSVVSIESTDDEFEVVGEAADGRAGVQLVEELRPDAVILDWQMPVLDGVSAAPQMRAIVPSLIIVMFSSRGSYGADEALAAGVDSYVDKEEGPRAVTAELRRLVEQRTGGEQPR